MQQLSIFGLDTYFEGLLQKIPEERKALFERLEPQLVAVVRDVIGGSGKVASWQVGALGTKGGYVATHPKPKMDWEGYSVGRITNAITSGHKTGKEGGWVPGKRYYENAAPLARDLLQREMEAMEKRLKEAAESCG